MTHILRDNKYFYTYSNIFFARIQILENVRSSPDSPADTKFNDSGVACDERC